MYEKMKNDSKNINQANNSIFKQLDTNIIFDYQKNNMVTELIPNQDIYSNYKTNIYKNKNLQIYLNGTTEPDENVNFMKTQRNKFSNISNKPNYHSNVNTTKNRGGLNRYNSYISFYFSTFFPIKYSPSNINLPLKSYFLPFSVSFPI